MVAVVIIVGTTVGIGVVTTLRHGANCGTGPLRPIACGLKATRLVGSII